MFIETPRFPANISKGSSGGPNYSTSIVPASSGHEQRNANWQFPIHEYETAYGVRGIHHLESLKAFFHVAKGRAHAFRFRDYADYKSCPVQDAISPTDQLIATGDGATLDFQLIKNYNVGPEASTRLIQKPVASTTRISLDAVEQLSGWTVDTTSGVVTFSIAPADGALISAGYEFDVPVRFSEDHLPTQLEMYNVGSARVGLMEIRVEEAL